MSKPVVELRGAECRDAAAIQAAIDHHATSACVIQLPELDLTLDRGLELHSGQELRGRGEATILHKGPSRSYAMSGYHNYGMCDVPLLTTDGLAVGMTVSVLDDKRGGFYSTFARITRIDDGWVGLDHGLQADLIAGDNPRLVTAYPLVFGHRVTDVAVRDLALDGNLPNNPHHMDACRGAAVYFASSRGIDITGIRERDFHGEGIGFQMCGDVTIRDSSCRGNTGNGLHPGAGSTNALFENCESRENRNCGFFFCVRANHITVRGCTFASNTGPGVSIGTRDCHNLIEDCTITGNGGPGVLARETPAPTEVHSCHILRCRLSNNAHASGHAQIEAVSDAHDLIIEECTLDGGGRTVGVATADNVRRVFLAGNEYADCTTETQGTGFSKQRPTIACGHGIAEPNHYRHLDGGSDD